MEDKKFEVCVERMNRIQTFFVCMVVILVAYGISAFLERVAGIKVKGEIILLFLVAIICFLLAKFEKFFPTTEILEVVFDADQVTFIRRKRKRSIFYRDIKEVEKMMIINRYHSDKGYYRVKIKAKGCTYAMYSGEDSNARLDFAEVGLSKIYAEFQNRDVKCC
ncbi:MAG: hypothetical protein E7288_10440 [Lachnospiraceae bacterium]|nr:hypothetical protein [Lachnospiraceae bacterium]